MHVQRHYDTCARPVQLPHGTGGERLIEVAFEIRVVERALGTVLVDRHHPRPPLACSALPTSPRPAPSSSTRLARRELAPQDTYWCSEFGATLNWYSGRSPSRSNFGW